MGRTLVVSGIAACVLSLAAPVAAAPCQIDAKKARIDKVKIVPKGGVAFELKLDKVPVTAVPGGGSTATLHVRAPLRFTAKSYPMGKLRVRVGKRTALFGGRVILAAGLAPTSLGPKGRSLHVKPPLHGFSLRHQSLAIPCSALTIASTDSRPEAPEFIVPTGRREHAVPDKYIPLYRTTKKAAPLWMKFSVPLMVVQRKGAWIKLEAKWKGGSSVQGWVPNKLVEVRLDEPMYGIGGLGTSGVGGMCGRSHRPTLVEFTVRRNAPVHQTAGGVVWAHAAQDIKVKAFTISRSDGWVQIAKVDGLPPPPCSEHKNMWVHAKHLVWSKATKKP